MKIHVLAAALGAALTLPLPALAAGPQQHNDAGHYEWRTIPQFGPRATGPAQKRVWVPDAPAADCMQGMHGGDRPSSAASAG